jgi:hypothetical protein
MENIKQSSIKNTGTENSVKKPSISKNNIKPKEEFKDNNYEEHLDVFYEDSFIESIL